MEYWIILYRRVNQALVFKVIWNETQPTAFDFSSRSEISAADCIDCKEKKKLNYYDTTTTNLYFVISTLQDSTHETLAWSTLRI